jgi:hypothetical protein
VNEHVFAAVFTLNEAEAFLRIEELDDPLALANDLSGHAATSAAATTARAAEAATAAARSTAAAEAAAITTAKAAASTAAAKTVAATAAKPITAAGTETVTAARKRIETVFAETVALVPASAATSSVKTHITERTFASPQVASSGSADESRRTTGQAAGLPARPSTLHLWHIPKVTP